MSRQAHQLIVSKSTSRIVTAGQCAPLRPEAHGKCGVCGSTVMTAQEWWLCGHQTGRCLRPERQEK